MTTFLFKGKYAKNLLYADLRRYGWGAIVTVGEIKASLLEDYNAVFEDGFVEGLLEEKSLKDSFEVYAMGGEGESRKYKLKFGE